jgi:hypothetical protein
MEVAFGRVPERQSEALVHLDGRVLVLPAPGNFRLSPPHDLGHFIVENTLRWQTGFWGYIARGVMFPSMYQKSGTRPPHGEEHSRSAIRGAKDHLAEGESLAGAVAAIVRENIDADPDRIRHIWKQAFWPPNSTAPNMPLDDIQCACLAFRQVDADWRALAMGDSLRFRWSFRANPLAPENPLDQRAPHRRRRAHR